MKKYRAMLRICDYIAQQCKLGMAISKRYFVFSQAIRAGRYVVGGDDSVYRSAALRWFRGNQSRLSWNIETSRVLLESLAIVLKR